MPRVLLLRPRSHAADLAFLLEEEGVDVEFLPLLDVPTPEDPRALRAALEHVTRFSWVLPDAPAAVRVISEVAHAAGTFAALEKLSFIAPDHATATTLGQYQWLPRILLPPLEPVEPVVDALQSVVNENDEVLILVGEHARGHSPWPLLLREVGARVTEATAYAAQPQRPGEPESSTRSTERAARLHPLFVIVHSPAAAQAFFATHENPSGLGAVTFIATGPSTARALKHLGATVCVTAQRPSSDAVVDAALAAMSE